MKILTYTSLFPNSEQPLHALFVKERVKAMAALCNADELGQASGEDKEPWSRRLRVVAPVPWFPALKTFSKYYAYSQVPPIEVFDGLTVYHPRYLTFPKVGKSMDGWLMYRLTLPTVQRIQQEFDFDIIDAHWAYPDGYAAVLLGQTLQKPVSVTIRGDDISTFADDPPRRRRIVYALNHARCGIAVCNALREAAAEKGANGESITVIPNGVDTEKFWAIPQEEARARLELPQERRIVLSLGHLTERKGFHHIIDAIKILVEQGETDLLLVIVGGANAEGDYRDKLEAQIRRVTLHNHVLLAGPQPHEDLYRWYSACDIFCLASSREGWPNVAFEALACGKPVVATNVWGIPEVICSDRYGVLVEERNGQALAKGIHQALGCKWDTDAIISYARENTWENAARKVIGRFTDVCSHSL